MEETTNHTSLPFLAQGGEMGELIRQKDWSKTALGDIDTWEVSLRTTLGIVLHSAFPMFLFWGKDLLCFYNDAYRPSLGMDGKHPAIGQKAKEVWSEIWDFIGPLIDQVMTTGHPVSFQDQLVGFFRNGQMEDIYWTFCYSAAFDDSGQISGVLVTCKETTETVLTKQKLVESESQFRAIADNIPNLAWMANADGWIYWYNKKWHEYTGKTAKEMEGWGWQSVHHPEVLPSVLTTWKHSLDHGQAFEMVFPLKGKDGHYRQFLTRVLPVYDEQGNITQWFGSNTDIQDQKSFRDELEKQVNERTAELVQLNESLKKSEARYHLMVEEVQDYAILYLNREGIVENWNAGAEKIKGYAANEIIGRSFSNFYTQEDQKRGLPLILLNTALKKGKAIQEGWRVKKDGSLFWASVVITAVHNDRREVIGFSKVTHDLTEKKTASDALEAKRLELEEKNAELQKMNKELQSFAYISSHDLQEPLRKIQTFASRINEKEHANLSDKGKELFSRMQRSAEQMQALINDLLAYSRTNTAEHVYQKVDLAGIIEKIKQDLTEELEEKHAKIILKNSAEVNVIHFQFQQMFYNLISNSIKFSHPERPLRIIITAEKVNGAQLPNRNQAREREFWHISITDNGIGFESEYSERIFELFQRLHGKSEYKGTGIGLSIVKKIAENHGGFITSKGEVGQGARFDLYLPVERN